MWQRQEIQTLLWKIVNMEEAKDLAKKMVELTDSQAEMAVYKHLNDHLEKYAQKLHRELNDIGFVSA